MRTQTLRTAAALALALAAASTRGAAQGTPAPAAAAAPSAGPNAGDVAFMQGMIAHHGQALTMAALVTTRSSDSRLRLLGERITVSQRDEIAAMRAWLAARHLPAGDEHDLHTMHDGGSTPSMPGMLTPQELAELATLTGPPFDRRFLELMLRHHEGALTMVAKLFDTQGAGQDGDVFRIASDVDADQRAEISRMRAMLAGMR